MRQRPRPLQAPSHGSHRGLLVHIAGQRKHCRWCSQRKSEIFSFCISIESLRNIAVLQMRKSGIKVEATSSLLQGQGETAEGWQRGAITAQRTQCSQQVTPAAGHTGPVLGWAPCLCMDITSHFQCSQSYTLYYSLLLCYFENKCT